jgi:predicted amidohydrolase YtcJ
MADFTVLARNPAETAFEDFARVRVEMTVVGGIETFE